jgi:hypothetical protein
MPATEQAQASQHRLKRGEDRLVLEAPVFGPSNGERRWQRRRETLLDSIDVSAGAEYDIDLIDTVFFAEPTLSRGDIHHRELSAKRRGEALGPKKTPRGETFDSLWSRKIDAIADVYVAPRGERFRQQDRVSVLERLNDGLAPRHSLDLIAP